MGDVWTGFGIDWVAAACGGRVIGTRAVRGNRFERDSRADVRGAVFVALRGERHDGHAFLSDVAARGAVAAIVESGRYDPASLGPMAGIEVPDAVAAIGGIARAHRRAVDPLVLALTGSCGKTSTKEMLAAILRRAGPTCATEGNLNNHIGVPFTLFRLRPGDQFAVVEMGCNHPGEIAALAEIAEPDVAAITCVGAAHLEGFGTIEGVARAKGEIFSGLSNDAAAVVNADDPRILPMPVGNARRVTAGESSSADVRLTGAVAEPGGGHRLSIRLASGAVVEASLRLPGRHQAVNATLAAAMAEVAGVPPEAIAAGLESVAAGKGRGAVLSGPNGIRVLDDTYNANPTSTIAALRALSSLPGGGRKVAVLGEMLELGASADSGHRSVGLAAAEVGVDLLVCAGPHAGVTGEGAVEGGLPADRVMVFAEVERLIDELPGRVSPGDRVLVKGSRGMRMERVVERLVGSRCDAV